MANAPTSRRRRGSSKGADGPARLVAAGLPSPFVPGREVTFARLEGGAMEPLDTIGLRPGDHVALVRRARASEGDLASIVGRDGRESLWKVPPPPGDGDAAHERPIRAGPRVRGVVVGVLRKFEDGTPPGRAA